MAYNPFDDVILNDPAYKMQIGGATQNTNFERAVYPTKRPDYSQETFKPVAAAISRAYKLLTPEQETLDQIEKDQQLRSLATQQAFQGTEFDKYAGDFDLPGSILQDPKALDLLNQAGFKRESFTEGLSRTGQFLYGNQRQAFEKLRDGEQLTSEDRLSIALAPLDSLDFLLPPVAIKKLAGIGLKNVNSILRSTSDLPEVQQVKQFFGGSPVPLVQDPAKGPPGMVTEPRVALAKEDGTGAGGTKVDIKIPKYYQGLIDKNTLGGPETKAKIEKVLRDYPDKLPKGAQQISKEYGMPNYKYLLATIYKRMSEGTLPKDYFNPQLRPGEFAGKEVQNIGSKKAAELSKQKFGPILKEIEAYYAANKSKFKDKGVAYFQSEVLKNTSIKSIKDKFLYDNFSGYEDIKKPGFKKDVYNKNANKKGNQTKAEKILEKHGIYGSERARSRNNFYTLVHSYRQDPRELEKLVKASGGLTKEEFKKLNPNLSSKEINEAYPEYSFNVGQKMIDDEYRMYIDLLEPENLSKFQVKIKVRDEFNKWVGGQIDEYFFNPNPTPQQAAFIEKFKTALTRATKKNYDDDKDFRRALISMYKTDLTHSFPIRAYTKEFPGAGGFADLIKVNFSGINTGQQAAVDKSIKRFLKDISDLPRNPDGSFKNTPENIEIIEKKISEIQKINDDFGERLVTSIHKIDDPQVAQLLKGAFPDRVDEKGKLLQIESFDEAERTKVKESKPSIVLGADIGNEPNLEDLKQYWLDHIRDGELGIKEPKFVGKRGPRGKRSPLAGIMGPVAPGTPDFSFFNRGGVSMVRGGVQMAIGGQNFTENMNKQDFTPDPAIEGDSAFQQAVQSGNLQALNLPKIFKGLGEAFGVFTPKKVGKPLTGDMSAVTPIAKSDFPLQSFTLEKINNLNIQSARPQDWINELQGGAAAPKSELLDSGLFQYLADFEKYFPNQKVSKDKLVEFLENNPISNLKIKIKGSETGDLQYDSYMGKPRHKNVGSARMDKAGEDYREVVIEAGTLPGQQKGDEFVNSSHFQEKNVLAFGRVGTYKNSAGDNVAVIQEMQTDYLTQVRKEQELLNAEIEKLNLQKTKAEQRLERAESPYDIERAKESLAEVNSKLPALLKLQESKLIKPYPNVAAADKIPEFNKQLQDLQKQINDLSMQGVRRENPEFLMQISNLEEQQKQVLNQLLDLNRANEYEMLAKDVKVPDIDDRDNLLRYINGSDSYVSMKNVKTFPPTPLNNQADYVDAILKAVIKDAENRGINKIAIMPADVGANARWSKESENAKKKFRNLYDKVGVQQLKNIAKKYGGSVQEEFVVDSTKGSLGLRFLNKDVDGNFQVLKETDIDPSVTIRREDLGPSKPPEGLNAFLNEEILRVAKDYGPNEVVFRREIAPGQTMEYFVNVKQGDVVDQKFDLVPLGDADRAENATIVIEEYNPQLVKMNVLVLPDSNKDKPMYLFKKKKGGIMPDDRLVSITDIYGDY